MHMDCALCAMKRCLDTTRLFGYDEMTVGDTGYCSGNVMNGPGLYLCNGLFVDMMKT